MKRTLIEAEEAFGAPQTYERIDGALEAVLTGAFFPDPRPNLAVAFAQAEKGAHAQYFAALGFGKEIAAAAHARDIEAMVAAMGRFFHAAAKVGEARTIITLSERLTAIRDELEVPA